MTNELESMKEIYRRELEGKISQAEAYMKELEEKDEKSIPLDVALELASVYSWLSKLYADSAVLTPKEVDDLSTAKSYLQDAEAEMEPFIKFGFYSQSKENLFEDIPSKVPQNKEAFEKKFAVFEGLFNSARENIISVARVSGLEKRLTEETTVQLNEEQSYMFAGAIRKAARIADTDNNYGCGFEEGREEEVIVKYLRAGEYLGLINDEITATHFSLETANENSAQEITAKLRLEKLEKLQEWISSCPSTTLFTLPEGAEIKCKMTVGSDLDRKYWQFIYHVISSSDVKRVSPSIQREYDRIKSYSLAPSVALNSDVYQLLKKEFPFIKCLDNPKAFQELLDVATGENGHDLIYQSLTGKKPASLAKLNYFTEKAGNFLGLPNEAIEGK
jgi:hypothetical protein